MGPVWDRRLEHLGTCDSMVIRTRRLLLNAARVLRDHGTVPPAVDTPEVFATRTGGLLLPDGADWYEGSRELARAFVEHKVRRPRPDASSRVNRICSDLTSRFDSRLPRPRGRSLEPNSERKLSLTVPLPV